MTLADADEITDIEDEKPGDKPEADDLTQDDGAANDAAASGAEAAEEQPAEDGADEVVIAFAGDSPAQEAEDLNRAPDWLKNLRKENRAKDRRIRELEQKLQGGAAPQAQEAEALPPKPALKDFDYDEDKHAEAMDGWYAKKAAIDRAKTAKEEAAAREKAAWDERLKAYQAGKSKLKVADFEDAEADALAVLSTTQQGVILNGSENPAALVYALGKSQKRARELAAIADPVKFAFAVAKLETTMTIAPRKPAPPMPEKTVRGAAPGAGQRAANLEALHEKARQTGDYSAYYAAKRAAEGSK